MAGVLKANQTGRYFCLARYGRFLKVCHTSLRSFLGCDGIDGVKRHHLLQSHSLNMTDFDFLKGTLDNHDVLQE